MQDLRDGTMNEIDVKKFGIRDAGVAAGIPLPFQGPVFQVGEEVKVKGGRFRVQSFGRKFMCLEGLPGTKIAKEK